MKKENAENKDKIEDLRLRFEALFSSSGLSDEEKNSLSQEILRIIYGGSEKVFQ